MKYLVSELYADFSCVGSECIDCCCKGWDIIIDQTALDNYNQMDATHRDFILPHIEVKNDQYMIKMTGDGVCPFLNIHGLCDLYIKVSPEALCYTCKTFPRIVKLFDDTVLATTSLSCPEVVRLLLKNREPLGFAYIENDMPVQESEVDWKRHNINIEYLVLVQDCLKDRGIELWKRLKLALRISVELDSYYANSNSDIDEVIIKYRDKTIRDEYYSTLRIDSLNMDTEWSLLYDIHAVIDRGIQELKQKDFFKNFACHSYARDQYEKYANAKDDYFSQYRNNEMYEKIACQSFFVHFMDSLEKGDFVANLLNIILYLVLLQTQEIIAFNKQFDEKKQIEIICTLTRLMEQSGALKAITNMFIKNNGEEGIGQLLSILAEV